MSAPAPPTIAHAADHRRPPPQAPRRSPPPAPRPRPRIPTRRPCPLAAGPFPPFQPTCNRLAVSARAPDVASPRPLPSGHAPPPLYRAHARPRPNTPPLPPEIARRRTFAIISHPDAGKTTLTEKFLLFGGAIQMAGQVRAKGEARRTRSDFMKMEQERGISVSASAMSFDFRHYRFNLVDTPGHTRLFRRHLPHADRGRRRDHGDRRRQGRGKPDPQAVRGLPPARPADPDLLQQDGPRKPRHLRDHRRDPGKPAPST